PRSRRRTSRARTASRRSPWPRTPAPYASFCSPGNASCSRRQVVGTKQASATQVAYAERRTEIGVLQQLRDGAREHALVVLRRRGAEVTGDERTRQFAQLRPKCEMQPLRRILGAHEEHERADVPVRIRLVVAAEAGILGRREVDEGDALGAALHQDIVEIEVAVDAMRV